MRFSGFVGPSYVSQSVNVAAQRCMNWYVEQVEVRDEPAQVVLYPTPGCSDFASLTSFPVSGITAVRTGGVDRCFAVSANTLYEIFPDGSSEDRGRVESETETPATFSGNVDAGDEIFITSGGRGYIFTLSTNVLTQVMIGSDTIPITSHQGDFLDGFFLALNRDTSTLYLSELNDGAATWDATQYAQRTAGSDPWQSLIVSNRDIWLFGKNTSEVWYNAGTAPFPFAAIPGAFIEEGIAAPASAAKFGNTVIWLGQSEEGGCVVWRANGYTPQRVSTHAVEYAIQGYMRDGRTVTDAVAMTYQESGHIFYVLGFPSADATWVYDGATNLWHERGTWDADNRQYCAWRPQSHAFAFEKHLVGNFKTGIVHEMSIDKFTDAGGVPIRRLRRTPHLNVEDRTLFYHKLQVMLQSGVGLSSGQGSDPQVMMRWSDDGSHTWGNEHWVSAGKMGQYSARAIWRRLGRGRNRVFEISVTDPVPWRVISANMDVSEGTS